MNRNSLCIEFQRSADVALDATASFCNFLICWLQKLKTVRVPCVVSRNRAHHVLTIKLIMSCGSHMTLFVVFNWINA
jgi:hypothetical protein